MQLPSPTARGSGQVFFFYIYTPYIRRISKKRSSSFTYRKEAVKSEFLDRFLLIRRIYGVYIYINFFSSFTYRKEAVKYEFHL